jgi:hypothetical protein
MPVPQVQGATQPASASREGPHPWLNFFLNLGLFIATARAFCAALWYAIIADKQRLASDMQLGALAHQVHVAERANELAEESAESSRVQSKTALDASIEGSRQGNPQVFNTRPSFPMPHLPVRL